MSIESLREAYWKPSIGVISPHSLRAEVRSIQDARGGSSIAALAQIFVKEGRDELLHSDNPMAGIGAVFLGETIIWLENAITHGTFDYRSFVAEVNWAFAGTFMAQAPATSRIEQEEIPPSQREAMLKEVQSKKTFCSFFETAEARKKLLPKILHSFLTNQTVMVKYKNADMEVEYSEFIINMIGSQLPFFESLAGVVTENPIAEDSTEKSDLLIGEIEKFLGIPPQSPNTV